MQCVVSDLAPVFNPGLDDLALGVFPQSSNYCAVGTPLLTTLAWVVVASAPVFADPAAVSDPGVVDGISVVLECVFSELSAV